MSKYLSRLTNKRQYSAVLGVTRAVSWVYRRKEFEKLLPVFSLFLEEEAKNIETKKLAERQRKSSKGNPPVLTTATDKLIFILYYLKNYPTQDTIAFNFDMCNSTANAYVKTLLTILEKTQKHMKIIPKSIIKTPEELAQLAEGKKILGDVTERLIYRHKNYDAQTAHYSGKKHAHTVMNTILSSAQKRCPEFIEGKILYIGKTFAGSLHDYNCFKQEFSPKKDWFSSVKIRVDLGYQGIKLVLSLSKQKIINQVKTY